MNDLNNFKNKFTVIRGATTASSNTNTDIENAVKELIQELISRNDLGPNEIHSIIFTVTRDLNVCFPASIARKYKGMESIAFLDCQQMFVPDDLEYCIRLMAFVNLPSGLTPNHPYLREASKLRPDRC